ncbi:MULTISPECIES: hypothetical protein [Paracoccaceae]|jgi:Flp pilus assembly pilin Flp|uniref:hypothetical protein n=1 Tax=Rhodobacterales TaxID=204455 RepID=UPI001B05B1FC|nr:hypothetical protein [Boseongicola sp. H5]MBO6604074.1 hypothetical protein [Roseicyclus sp.]MBO6624910.1 hypothetical protein [Roseicyclus sp.]MBO6921261.1 hypothetical protein [Roseicyclus sp.]
MSEYFRQFLRDESGAITVDWVVLSAAAVSMAIAATDVLEGSIGELASDLEAQLRTQQISDSFVQFTSAHFEPFYQQDTLTVAQAEQLFTNANEMTNAAILTALESGISAMNAGTLTDAQMAELVAVASVAYQRNIVDDAVIEQFFSDIHTV